MMAGIDKIYGTPRQAREFIRWVEAEGDKAFRDEFGEAGDVSLKDFMYVDSCDSLEGLSDDRELPLTNFPTLVDKWIYRQPGLPSFARDRIGEQYGLDKRNPDGTPRDPDGFLTSPVEVPDDRVMGTHAKIIHREGVLAHSDYCLRPCMEVLVSDGFYWHCTENDEWECDKYMKKRNVCSSISSVKHYAKKMSVRAVIRQMLKRRQLPAGTVVAISDLTYSGEIRLLVRR